LLLLQHLQLQAAQSLHFHLVWRSLAQWRIVSALLSYTTLLFLVARLALCLTHFGIDDSNIAAFARRPGPGRG
jgi:hypothetical protein